jgi:hypothetical protein
MKILTSYEFKRPSRSRVAPVVSLLVDEGVFAVHLERGDEIWRDSDNADSLKNTLSTEVRKRGRRARIFTESDDAIVVSLWPEGEGPRARKKRARVAA